MLAMAVRNVLLARLPVQELEDISPFLSQIWLPADSKILSREERPEHVYFPESAIISSVAHGSNGRNCHVSLYGHEGFGSTCAILGVPTSPNDEVVQCAGYALRLPVSELSGLLITLPELQRRLNCYLHIVMMQVAYTAFANGSTRIEQRLARWLLMYQDRAFTSSLAITHQRLSDILGVRRSGITEAIHLLEGERLIRGQRGLIDILDRPRLALLTAGSYGAPEAEYLRLL